jgi:proteasome lid subunit RPN8/RPN11
MSDGRRSARDGGPTPRPTLTLSRTAYDRVVEHAREGSPEEVCGVLGGSTASGERKPRRAHTALPVANVAADPRTRYELDPSEQLRRIEAVEDAGDAVVGFYHSHPRGPAGPSETDRALATWPGTSYVIVSLGGVDPEVGSWRWTGERFVAERVTIEG